MKKDRIVINRQMLLLPVVLLLSSCVTFRPDFYDSETKTYNNYKNNYSVKILDDFEFTTKDSIKDPFSRSYVSQLPLNAKFVYNKEYPIFITFFEYQNASVKFYQRFIQNKDNIPHKIDISKYIDNKYQLDEFRSAINDKIKKYA